MLVIFYDNRRQINPVNLGAVKCPKILSVRGTHYSDKPLQSVIDTAQREPYDLVMYWSRTGIIYIFSGSRESVRRRWLPFFSISPTEYEPLGAGMPRERGVSFLGTQEEHPYREHVLKALLKRGVRVDVGRGSHVGIASEYTKTRVNLNISRNGDLNLRVFEVLAAGGFLITE